MKTATFFENYPIFKQEENWQAIINLGLMVIESPEPKIAKIHLIVSSCYHYLGDFQTALNHAGLASKLAESNINLLGNSYYLLSAANRSLSLKSSEHQYKKEAHFWINKALELTDQAAISSQVAGKIFFNAGALEHDVENNLPKASFYYQNAMERFDYTSDDYIRTAIRNIRVLLESNNLQEANDQATSLKISNDQNSKTDVHILQLRSKIAHKLGEKEKSIDYCNLALQIATKKNMQGDLKRLNELMESLTNPTSQVSKVEIAKEQTLSSLK